jgi:hypothetical protein
MEFNQMNDEVKYCPNCSDSEELQYVSKQIMDGLFTEQLFCEMCQKWFDDETIEEIVWVNGHFKKAPSKQIVGEKTQARLNQLINVEMDWWEAEKGKYQRRFDTSNEDLQKEIDDDFKAYLNKHYPHLSKEE